MIISASGADRFLKLFLLSVTLYDIYVLIS